MSTVLSVQCIQAQSVLIAIDIQTRLMAAMQTADRTALMGNAGKLLRAAGLLDIPSLITEQYPKGLGSTEPTLKGQQTGVCETIEKTRFSARGVAEFDQSLAMTGRKQVVICGAETHVCVLQTAMNLLNDGIEVFIAGDAVCSRDPRNRDNALDRMRAAGAIISNTESIIFEWLGDSKHPSFRDVSALIQ